MSSVYKYIPEQYVANFLRGEVLFRSLSYFRDLEDEEKKVRGDMYEGTRLHQKPEGLDLMLNDDPKPTIMQGSFESRVQSDDIFVFCLSTVLSTDLANDFKTTACIEIHNPSYLIGRIRSALERRPSVKNKKLLHDTVQYYGPEQEVGVAWALPDRIAMSKTRDYEWQSEYRLAFSIKNAFEIGTTQHAFVLPNREWEKLPSSYPEMLLKVGDLRRCCKVWEFDTNGVPVEKLGRF
ncbi:hypothetical protein [Janthinobacterium sp. BJB304]|uniref:hypothetical protein n=1 Tax=Janthinobacterium sp. BJB304 TaxID=1572871 RepID=UPI000C0E24BF|nr:hypothetical protein [Janthinobacterium sp. BJB304]PHV38586.1 hypothetical protein CSQ95_12220 [Janthinobacterium sp. BJB304]